MQIRFDHRPAGVAGAAGQGAVFANPHQLIEAYRPGDVAPALAKLDRARHAGYWLAGYMTYEAGYALEPKLHHLMPPNRRLPLLRFGLFDAPYVDAPRIAPCDALRTADRADGTAKDSIASLGRLHPRWDQSRYELAFDQVKQAIGAGEIYQANLTFPIDVAAVGTPEALYQALQMRQPVQHGALVVQPGLPAILSRSPELFFRTDAQGRIATRPMKGTSPRDADRTRDLANKNFLHSDTKNRAENLMIVDLLRNDIAKLAEIGSVQVPELFLIESYATLHQMVSTVTAKLRPGVGLAEILTALFPCGSITGAPKIQAMQILRRLEPSPREIYCGTIGWAAPDGQSEFNVAIRSLMLDQGDAVLNVGGGIVWDSTAKSEYQEALWKTRFATLPRTHPF